MNDSLCLVSVMWMDVDILVRAFRKTLCVYSIVTMVVRYDCLMLWRIYLINPKLCFPLELFVDDIWLSFVWGCRSLLDLLFEFYSALVFMVCDWCLWVDPGWRYNWSFYILGLSYFVGYILIPCFRWKYIFVFTKCYSIETVWSFVEWYFQ